MSLEYLSDEEAENEAPGSDVGIDRPGLPLYSIILIAGILAVFGAQVVTGLDDSVELAGFVKPAFIAQHQYWRILTGATTHGSLLHVGLNCYAFYNIGKIVEMLSNRAHLAIVFLLSALGGGVLSLVFMPSNTSVGASGGIVGLIGYLLVYAFRRRQFISSEFRRSLLINVAFILIYGLVLYTVIDNFGHIGGLITGLGYGLFQIPSDVHTDPREAVPAVEITGIIAVGVYIAACCFSILLILSFV